MSTVYNGVSENVSPPTALTVTNTTNTAPSTVTISGTLPASIQTTFDVDISGIVGSTSVNGRWLATKTGASTFTVPVGVPPGSYTSGGSAQPILLQGITIPADGDALTASSVNTPIESLQDQLTYLLLATGQYKIVNAFSFGTGFTLNGSTGSCPNTTGGTWADWTGAIAGLMPFCQGSGVGPLNVLAGDQVAVRVTGNLLGGAGTTNNCMTSIWYANWVPGGTETFSQANLTGAQVRTSASASGVVSPFTLSGLLPGITIGSMITGLFDFKIRLITTGNATAADFALLSGFYAEAVVLRPNITVPQ